MTLFALEPSWGTSLLVTVEGRLDQIWCVWVLRLEQKCAGRQACGALPLDLLIWQDHMILDSMLKANWDVLVYKHFILDSHLRQVCFKRHLALNSAVLSSRSMAKYGKTTWLSFVQRHAVKAAGVLPACNMCMKHILMSIFWESTALPTSICRFLLSFFHNNTNTTPSERGKAWANE